MAEVAAAVAQSVAALATTGAVVVALWVAHHDWARADRESRQRQAARARLVLLNYRVGQPFQVEVVNRTREPILDVKVVDAGRVDREEGSWWQIEPGVPASAFASRSPFTPASSVTRFVDTDATWRIPLQLLTPDGHGYGGTPRYTYTVTVQYTDADGVRWERTDNQLPRRL